MADSTLFTAVNVAYISEDTQSDYFNIIVFLMDSGLCFTWKGILYYYSIYPSA